MAALPAAASAAAAASEAERLVAAGRPGDVARALDTVELQVREVMGRERARNSLALFVSLLTPIPFLAPSFSPTTRTSWPRPGPRPPTCWPTS